MPEDAIAKVDHLVYATPDLDAGIADLEHRLGVRAAYGGRHPGRGTWNAVIALSDSSYLEIIAPDPEQRDIGGIRWFVAGVTAPRLVTWAAKTNDIERTAADAARLGVAMGPVGQGSRQTADGSVLRWRFTDPQIIIERGLVPFLIDWGNGPHPASSAPSGPRLLSLRAEHPDPERVERMLSALGIEMTVDHAPEPALIARLSTARGDVELR